MRSVRGKNKVLIYKTLQIKKILSSLLDLMLGYTLVSSRGQQMCG